MLSIFAIPKGYGLGVSIYDVRKIFRFFTVTNQLILFLTSACGGPPSPPTTANVIYGSLLRQSVTDTQEAAVRKGRHRGADILTLKHISRILGHFNNPALPFCPVCGRGISFWSMLKYSLENEKQEVLGCGYVR